jgi:hypothetical protein
MEQSNKPAKTLCSICKKNCESVKQDGELEIGGTCPDVELVKHEPPYCPSCGEPLTEVVESYQSATRFIWNPERKIYEESKEDTYEAERTCNHNGCWHTLEGEEDEFFFDHVETKEMALRSDLDELRKAYREWQETDLKDDDYEEKWDAFIRLCERVLR